VHARIKKEEAPNRVIKNCLENWLILINRLILACVFLTPSHVGKRYIDDNLSHQ